MKTVIPLTKRPVFNAAISIMVFFLFLLLPSALLAGNVLDKLGNPTATSLAAFSVRQLSTAYAGKALQVRRSSDNTTLDIGFTTAGDLDTVALKAFVGGNNGYVKIWYDQSGNGYNATQATNAYQPILVTSGVINRDNGWPSVYTNSNGAASSMFLTYGSLTPLNGTIVATRMEVTRCRVTNGYTISSGVGGNYQLDLQLFSNTNTGMVQVETTNITAGGSITDATALMAINSIRASGASKFYVNTALVGTNASAALTNFSSPVTGYIGVRFDYTLGPTGTGAFSESILFNSVLSDPDRQAMNYNQNWYYSLGFDPCSSTLASLSTNGMTNKALYACTADGPYAYYYDPAHPLKLLFGIAKDPGSTGANPSFTIDSINLTTTSNPSSVYYSATSGTEGVFALGRYWNVYTHTPLTSPVNVRFFFNPADTVAARNAALAFKTATLANLMSNLQWFKTVGVPFSPANLSPTTGSHINVPFVVLTPVYGIKDGINYAEFDGVTSFSGGTGAYVVSNTFALLPNIFGSFTGTRVNETVALSWATESESNSDRFEIERSADGSTWTTIGRVAAAGNSSTVLSYRYTDTLSSHEGGSLYYRLKLTDKDGQGTWSGIVSVKMYDNATGIPRLSRIVPNPFGTDMEITCTLPGNGLVEVLLQDMAGATLIRREYTVNKGDNMLRLTNLNGLARGTYIVRVVQGGAACIAKVIKQ